jgi:hypothetical protein
VRSHRHTQVSHDRRYPGAPRSDEIIAGVQAEEHVPAREERRPGGTWAKGASTDQRKGGRALKNRTALSHRTGLAGLVALPAFKPYLAQARAFAKAHVATLARSVGGGECGAGPASVVTTAALQLAASRFCFDQASLTGDADLFLKASKLGDASRNNLLSASDLCAAEAQARPKADPLAAARARISATAAAARKDDPK